MDDAWNEKIPAQCTRNTKRALQPALCYAVLWDVCSLGRGGRGVCIFEKHPSISLCTKVNKGQKERRQMEIPPAMQEQLQHEACALLLAAGWVLQEWDRFCSSAGYLEQIFSWCKDLLKLVSTAHIDLCGAKRNGANFCGVSILCYLRMVWDK